MAITVRVGDTDYPWVGELTGREARELKRISGVRLGELEEALAAGDYDVLIAIAVIAMRRSGKSVDEYTLLDEPAGHVAYVMDDAEDDAQVPPADAPAAAGDRAPNPTETAESSGTPA